MSDATIIIIINVVCATILALQANWLRQSVNGMLPEIQDVRKQLIEANKFIIAQGAQKQELMDELAMRKQVLSPEQFEKLFNQSPPLTKQK